MDLKENITIMREMRDMKKYTQNFQKWENAIIEMKHSANGINNKTGKTEDNISELKGKAIETIQMEAKDKNTEKDEPVGYYQMFQQLQKEKRKRGDWKY